MIFIFRYHFRAQNVPEYRCTKYLSCVLTRVERQGVAKCGFIRDRGTSVPDHPENPVPSW